MRIDEYLDARSALIEKALRTILAERHRAVEPRLLEAMEYSLLLGGKRIRPILAVAATEAVGGEADAALPFACAIEMVHTYSLIHDDLPAMDDDDLRRGRPSSHKVFGEGIAILAGDALLTDAFAVMSEAGADEAIRVGAIRELALAAGAAGMVGGQTPDRLAEGESVGVERLESIHRRKTGALLRASVRVGAIVAGASSDVLERLTRYAEATGLAFQVADDLLDELGNTEATGKSLQRDRARGKSTYPSVLGITGARTLLGDLLERSLAAVESLGAPAEPLRGIARMVVARALH